MTGSTYILYTDDSGDETESLYTAVLIPLELWSLYLGRWLKFRQWLYTKHKVPARYELHAFEWVMAKDTPVPELSNDAPINVSRALRHEITIKALKTIGAMWDLRVITCRHSGPVKADAYRALIASLDSQLVLNDSWAVVVTDGDPKNPDPHVRQAHRDLDIKTRRVIEDGWLQSSDSSQLIQMADLAAYCAFQGHKRAADRKFMWDWYAEHLHHLEWQCSCP